MTAPKHATEPTNLPSTKQATLFAGEQQAEDEREQQRAHDRRVDLLITPKGHQRLRAFGYEVIDTGNASLPPTTSDRRSL